MAGAGAGRGGAGERRGGGGGSSVEDKQWMAGLREWTPGICSQAASRPASSSDAACTATAALIETRGRDRTLVPNLTGAHTRPRAPGTGEARVQAAQRREGSAGGLRGAGEGGL